MQAEKKSLCDFADVAIQSARPAENAIKRVNGQIMKLKFFRRTHLVHFYIDRLCSLCDTNYILGLRGAVLIEGAAKNSKV